MRTHIQLVSNPASGSYSPDLLARLAAEFIRQGARISHGQSSPQQALLIDASAQCLCVVGGDGTLRHVVAALAARRAAAPDGDEIALAAYPGGTVNLMQLEIRVPLALPEFVRQTLHGAARRQYAATLNDSCFLACASVGPDSAAVAALNEKLKRVIGKLAYVVAFLGVLWRWPRPRLWVHLGDRRLPCEAVYLAKGAYFAGPWRIAPAARMDAACIHGAIITSLTRWRYLRFMLALLCARPVAAVPGVETFTCTDLTITPRTDGQAATPPTTAWPVQGDGDIIGALPAQVAVDVAGYMVVR